MDQVVQESAELDKKVRGRVIRYIIIGFIYMVSVIIGVACLWSNCRLNISLNEIVNTIFGNLEGSDNSAVLDALAFCAPLVIIFAAIMAAAFVYDRKLVKKILDKEDTDSDRDSLYKRLVRTRIITAAFSVMTLLGMLLYVEHSYGVIDFISAKFDDSSIYENYYVSPDSVAITPNGQAKNLIYIYIESMETTYASEAEGGIQTDNYIPNLTRFAKENVSFSNTDKLGGFYSNCGSTWTMGALFTSSSGVPYALPLEGNTAPEYDSFASGLITLGDILEQQGYYNEFLCGSDADFAGRKLFYQSHGNYNIYDYYTAIDEGVIPSDYKEWWGYEDEKLYDIAKSELTRIAESGQPFNFTMLTADTHFPEGYECKQCRKDFPVYAANVVACADRQAANFINWIKEQPFYENTLVVVSGDHPRMDTVLVEDVEYMDRTVYNCFINTDVTPQRNTSNRRFSTYDMFPTVLAAMGFDIEGDRLGLGTNMFSAEKTLVEKLGIQYIEDELVKNSEFYLREFAPEFLEDEDK